ncbi:toll-like receptor 22 [Parambassis ranga]|uniref:Toll-like receptor 22 n=1 Tax=Parambassis ranga TaxID=210632 RepID=A0A6P7KGN3_9TELE|nr:toll-like receptor 13 [Parambassis ranga]
MCPLLEGSQTRPKGGARRHKLATFFLFLTILNCIGRDDGYSLQSCRITKNSAVCVNIIREKLKAVPHDIPPTVTSLDLHNNHISRINVSDFKDLPVLTVLDLNKNVISAIDGGAFAKLISLEKLNLNNNRLAKLHERVFEGLSRLTVLRVSRNKIKQVDSASLRSLTSLKFLDISYNKLAHITNVHAILQQLPHLQELHVNNNGLTTFQSRYLTNTSVELCYIDLSQNPITAFRITADVFPNLTWFKIGNSNIKQDMVWDVRNKTFLGEVSTLDISGVQMALGDMKTLLETVNSSLTTLRMNGMKHSLSKLIAISCTIPTMSTLQLRDNKLNFIGSDLFGSCVNVIELDLTQNRIKNLHDDAFVSLHRLRILNLSHNKISTVPAATRNLPVLSELDLSTNLITALGCDDFANQTKLRELSLYKNPIPTLNGCLFKDLTHLEVLKLQTCGINKLNGAFKESLANLRQLHLNENKLTAIGSGEFKGLKSLQNLSLHQNEIEALNYQSFIGLTNLTVLLLQQNRLSTKQMGSFNVLTNLRKLDLSVNTINYLNHSAVTEPPFSKLSYLEELNMGSQHHRQSSYLPRNFLSGLNNLLFFNIKDSRLRFLHQDTFMYTPQLQILDIISNSALQIYSELLSPLKNLQQLYISRTKKVLHSLNFLINANLTELRFLQARENEYSIVTEDIIKSLPALVFLDLLGNSLACDCSNGWFVNWTINDKETQVFNAYNFTCSYPPDSQGNRLLDFDFQSCSVDKAFICFVSTTCAVLCFMAASFTYHFMRWHLVYGYYLFLAWLFDTKHKSEETPYQYDAFISYNAYDEPWVVGELLPKLEGEQGWKLCLHHRDFEPGKAIIDNITDTIYGSRKTICVISRRYLESEWCSKEIQVASFRLFDTQKDVLILVFLEEIPSSMLSPYHRMRKLLKRQTYLSWPRAAEHTDLFWEKLRQALRTGEEEVDEEGGLLAMVTKA